MLEKKQIKGQLPPTASELTLDKHSAKWSRELKDSIPMLVLEELCRTILHRLRRDFGEYTGRTPYMRSNILSMYNDWPRRTYAQVRAVIQETIERIDRKGLTAEAA